MSHQPIKLGGLTVSDGATRHYFSPGHTLCRKEQPLCISLGLPDTVYAAAEADVTCIGCKEVLEQPLCKWCRGYGINPTILMTKRQLCPACDGRGRRSP